MRRSRRNGQGGPEFGSSGEDSFVAVVVTKLTGALLFILLLAMVIMALLPKAMDLPASSEREAESQRLTITTPETLPEAIAGRPYALALAATGGQGPLRWAIDGKLPEGLSFDPETGQLRGTPKAGTPGPLALVVRVSDGTSRASQAIQFTVYESDRSLAIPSKWKPKLPPLPWRAWMEQGFGFLVLILVHALGMNTLAGLERWSARSSVGEEEAESHARSRRRRFALYRLVLRLATLSALVVLALWLWRQHT
jgi:hypothetical protein